MTKHIYATGIYHEISNANYHASAGISRSGMMEFKRAPIFYWHKYLNPDYKHEAPSAAMEFGTAVHAFILEPEKFAEEYFVMEKNPFHGATKAGKIFKAEQLELVGNKTIITQANFDILLDMAASIKENPQTDGLITGALYEQSIYWTDKDTGLLCKARPDILHSNFIVDLKTADDASEYKFQRSVYHFGYHVQMAMLREGVLQTTGKDIKDFIFLVIEKSAPYATAIYTLDESFLDRGLNEFKLILLQMKNCFDENVWPSYPSKNICLPAYLESL